LTNAVTNNIRANTMERNKKGGICQMMPRKRVVLPVVGDYHETQCKCNDFSSIFKAFGRIVCVVGIILLILN